MMLNDARIVRSPFPDISIPDNISFHNYIYRRFKQYGDRTAIVDGLTGRAYSFRQLDSLTNNIASALIRRGLQKGDVVCLFLPNLPEYPLALFGSLVAGGTVTTANPVYNERELTHQLKDANAKFVVTTSQFADLAGEAARRSGTVDEIFVIGNSRSDVPAGCTGFGELMNDDGTALPSSLTILPKKDVAVLPYSSGTTGLSKGVMLSHYNLVSNVCQVASSTLLLKARTEDKVALAVLPFFHIYGLASILSRDLEQGTKIVTLPKFEPEHFLKQLEVNAIARALIAPPVVLFMAKHPMIDNYDLSSLTDILSGAAPLSGEITEALRNRLGIEVIRQGYGLTETSPVTHLSPIEGWKPGSIGFPLPNTECKVVDIESGSRAVGVNETGQLCVRGPQVMMGYLNNPTATRDCIDEDNWFHTGDIGHYDSDFHFYVTDRLKELIKVKGFQVAPAELEALLIEHADITDAAVIGVPDERAGEVPRAFVVPREGSDLSTESVVNYVKSQVAGYKELKGGVQFIDVIPKSASGKILRRVLRDEEKHEK
ncbi:uncharacterized protein LOC134179554 [Corticium candelabrum]|uniref:uncharacterized protein LOC134179554 n=1 Tax=Corticium candelabrum TaxID=121492 RepID=UPI002E26A055|nr:uncharacterized protein LOC134179554 [Corticium candelabrum]